MGIPAPGARSSPTGRKLSCGSSHRDLPKRRSKCLSLTRSSICSVWVQSRRYLPCPWAVSINCLHSAPFAPAERSELSKVVPEPVLNPLKIALYHERNIVNCRGQLWVDAVEKVKN